MQKALVQPSVQKTEGSTLAWAVWSVVAAFGVYFCMYAFRKPFTAAHYDHETVWQINQKTVLITAQVLGYMLSKFIGIRVAAETLPSRRASMILLLVAAAEVPLILFGIAPSPWHVVCLFLNGLPLGMVFGIVVGFLEGRRNTEALTAGLCASFILADGVVTSVGKWLLHQGVTERWMPALAGLIFVPPLLLFAWMLTQIPPPAAEDVARRSARPPMTREDRWAFFGQYAIGLFFLVGMYLMVTIARSMRAYFGPEIWRGLGVEIDPNTFTRTELPIALCVLVITGLSILISDNRRALFTSLFVSLAGTGLMAVALVGQQESWLSGFAFMVLLGLGMYLPYVAVHTTIFERMIAATRARGNLGFLMNFADAIGYLGFVGVMLAKSALSDDQDFLPFFTKACWTTALISAAFILVSWLYFARKISPTSTRRNSP